MGGINRGISLRYATLSEQVDGSLPRERLLATLSGFFGGLALLLAAVGLYGTMAYSVARRRNEIGIRIALGAARARVIRLVLGEVGRMVVVGVALGGARGARGALGGALPLRRRRLRPGHLGALRPHPGPAAPAAGALPAWRAAQLDPMESLREE